MEHYTGEENTRIVSVLVDHLEAAKTKDIVLLNNTFTTDGLFVGTDDTEQWPIQRLSQLLEESKDGWDMTSCTERSIYKVGKSFGDVAAFFEVVINKKYGPMRGSGVVVRDSDGYWKIKHYVLSFSVPNHVVDQTNILELLAS